MKNILLATSLLLSVTGVHGAVQYEFRQTFHSDVEALPSNNMTGRGIIDGDRYRVEFLSGTAFPAGSYLISNATKQQIWVDPSKKSYVEVNAASVPAAPAPPRAAPMSQRANEKENAGPPLEKNPGGGKPPPAPPPPGAGAT